MKQVTNVKNDNMIITTITKWLLIDILYFLMYFISTSALGSSKIIDLHVMHVKSEAPGDFFENSTWYLSVTYNTSFINCQFSG